MAKRPAGTVPVYGHMVDHPLRGWIRVGRLATDKAAIKSWTSFVKSAWHGCPTRVVHVANTLPSLSRPADQGGA